MEEAFRQQSHVGTQHPARASRPPMKALITKLRFVKAPALLSPKAQITLAVEGLNNHKSGKREINLKILHRPLLRGKEMRGPLPVGGCRQSGDPAGCFRRPPSDPSPPLPLGGSPRRLTASSAKPATGPSVPLPAMHLGKSIWVWPVFSARSLGMFLIGVGLASAKTEGKVGSLSREHGPVRA